VLGPEQRNYRFPAIYFESTRLCNLQCPMCMAGSNDAERVRASRRHELSFDEIRDLVLLPAKLAGRGSGHTRRVSSKHDPCHLVPPFQRDRLQI
jgi:hypothetical protein